MTDPERDWALIAIHSSLVWGFLVAPLVFYLVDRDRSVERRAHARSAFNFQVTVYLWGAMSLPLAIHYGSIGGLNMLLAITAGYVFAGRAVARTWRAKDPGYPPALPILRPAVTRGVAT